MRAAWIVLIGVLCPADLLAQQAVQDDIDRNLQERRSRAFELQLDLEPKGMPAPLPPAEVRRESVMPPGGTGILEVLPQVPSPGVPGAVTGPIDSVGVPALIDSQRRRQQGLQAQTRDLPDAQRRQWLDVQQLQFERERQSERLRSEIMRNSERATGR